MDRRLLYGKPVYIFEEHNVGLAAWADVKANHNTPLILLTLDHHTDVHEAFISWAFQENDRHLDNVEPIIEERLSRVNLVDPESLKIAVNDLRNDEQIDAALRLGIFYLAFCFNNQHHNTRSIAEQEFIDSWEPGAIPPEPPFFYDVPKRRIFEIGEICAIGCERMPHNDDCVEPAANQAIESVMLQRLIDTANSIALSADIADVTKVPYVLDIDLDYFRTKAAVLPKDPKVFHQLIRDAVAITIATEPEFVRMERIDDTTSGYALENILQHIDQALSAC
jgi:hypothetical protein